MKLNKIITLAWMVTFFAFSPLLLAEQIILEKGESKIDLEQPAATDSVPSPQNRIVEGLMNFVFKLEGTSCQNKHPITKAW